MAKLFRNGILVSMVLFFASLLFSSCANEEENDVFRQVSTQLDEIGTTDEEDEKKQTPG